MTDIASRISLRYRGFKDFSATVGETLPCECDVAIDKTRKSARVEFCSEAHAYSFWMHWAMVLEQDPTSD